MEFDLNTDEDSYGRLRGVVPGALVRVLLGHHDEGTAYRRGRARNWIECRARWGQRMCEQTARSTQVRRYGYVAAVAMYLDDEGGVRWASLPKGSTVTRIDAFVRRFATAMADPHLASAIALARACAQSATAISPPFEPEGKFEEEEQ